MELWLISIIVIILGLFIFKLYQILTCGMCRSNARMTGKVVIVTGSDRGLGYATATELARRGARVILACVDTEQAIKAQDDIIETTGNTNVEYKHLDLSSLSSVRAFADNILNSEQRLDVLINNAGVYNQGQKKTSDGLIVEAQINYFAPFLLTNLLLPLLKSSAPSRIVNVASSLHWFGSSDFRKLHKKNYWDALVYSNTKLCTVLFTMELSRLLEGTGVVANCLHPGSSRSKIYSSGNFAVRAFSAFYNKVFFKNEWQGAQTSIHLAVAPECEKISGKYFSDCRLQYVSPKAMSVPKAKELWDLSAKAVNLSNYETGIKYSNEIGIFTLSV